MTCTGFSRSIPGYSRYRMIGNDSLNEFHLEIVNSTLSDEAEYQCQVLPAVNDTALIATAHLTVIGMTSCTCLSSVSQVITVNFITYRNFPTNEVFNLSAS